MRMDPAPPAETMAPMPTVSGSPVCGQAIASANQSTFEISPELLKDLQKPRRTAHEETESASAVLALVESATRSAVSLVYCCAITIVTPDWLVAVPMVTLTETTELSGTSPPVHLHLNQEHSGGLPGG